MKVRAGQITLAIVATIATLACLALAFRVVGWLGVGILGLATALVAVQVDMDSAAPIGTQQNTGQFARTMAARNSGDRAERASRHADAASRGPILLVAKVVGVALAIIGGTGFFLVQLPG